MEQVSVLIKKRNVHPKLKNPVIVSSLDADGKSGEVS